ncbi:MAG: TlpA disulfide reductase family protein [Bacteroidota bacterium]
MLKKYGWLIAVLLVAGFYIGRYLYFMPKFTNGRPAPNFSGQLIDGSDFALENLRGQYVLLDFWGSWCGPCRAENPSIVALHSKYKGEQFDNAEGFVVVNVGVERDSSRWSRAIVQDQLNWPYHLMDESSSLKFFNGTVSSLYGIKEVPTSYLIDPQGQIIGVNMEVGQVARLLDQQLSK